MDIDAMTSGGSWKEVADLARQVEGAGFSGLLFTEATRVPWMNVTAAALAAPSLTLLTGIAVAFARSPMVSAMVAWEMAANTGGRFRLGLGSQVKAHIERRYGAAYDPPGPRLRDYVGAVRACFAAFSGGRPLDHAGPYYRLSLLPPQWSPGPLTAGIGTPPIDISAVGPYMCRLAGEAADGVHVHPFHSPAYLREALGPALAEGARRAGRDSRDVALIVPVFTIVGDSPAEREPIKAYVRQQIAFYGSTRNYAQQFDRLGFSGVSARLNERLKAGDLPGMSALITDEMLEHYAVTASWAELGGKLLERYRGQAARLVMYCVEATRRQLPDALTRWARVARDVRSG